MRFPQAVLDRIARKSFAAAGLDRAFQSASWSGHRMSGHRITMISIFSGGLMIAGLFTFVPGRVMHAVAFGP